MGGDNITTTVEGRERYPVNVRYPRELRDNVDRLGRVMVSAPGGLTVPLAQLAEIKLVNGPAMIRDENGFMAGYVYVDMAGRDIGGYVKEARQAVREAVPLPAGYHLQWSGQYENMLRVADRLRVVVPITLVLIFVLLYLNTKSVFKALLVMLAVPFSAVGAIWLFHLLDYNVSIAAWVGMIALLGLDAETGVFMLLFLDLSYDDARKRGELRSRRDLDEAIVHGAVKRVRPKLMTVCDDAHGPAPDPLVHIGRRGCHEADRRADDRRSHHVVPDGAARLSRHLQALEAAHRTERDPGGVAGGLKDGGARTSRLTGSAPGFTIIRPQWSGSTPGGRHRS